MIELHKSVNLLHHALTLCEENDLKPLNATTMDRTFWGVEIGFKLNPNKLLPVKENEYNKAKLFDGCSFTTKNGYELPSYKPLTYGHHYKDLYPNTLLSDFSVIDFDKQPIRCCASFILQNYVTSNIGYEDFKNRDDLISIAIKIHKYNKPILEPHKIPTQIDTWCLQGILLPLSNSSWQYDGYFDLLAQSICDISDKLMSELFPYGNENNRERASRLLKLGALKYSTIQYKYYRSRLEDNIDILLLKIDCVPLMKSKVNNETIKLKKGDMNDYYTIFLVFDLSNNELLLYHYSICRCYNGHHIYSHFRGFLLLIRCI